MALNPLLFSFPATSEAAASATTRMYIGTYTGGKSEGIYTAVFDAATGKIGPVDLAAKAKNPSFLAAHPNGKFLYSVGEVGDFGPRREGVVSAYRIDEGSGRLELLNQQGSGGGGPCHLSLDSHGRCVLTANYGSGSIAALPVSPEGKLGEAVSVVQHQGSSVNRQRQAGPHAHQIVCDAANRFALVCDLGLDKVLCYKLDAAKASLVPNEPASAAVEAGAGPRHLAFHPNGKLLFVINEMGSSVTSFAYAAERGELKPLQTISTLPADFKGASSCAEILVHPSGKFLFASNRGHDSIAAYSIDSGSGRLTLVGHQPTQGKMPRHFAIDPTGKWLLAENQDSDNIVVFSIDPESGKLQPTGQVVEIDKPVCVEFVPRR